MPPLSFNEKVVRMRHMAEYSWHFINFTHGQNISINQWIKPATKNDPITVEVDTCIETTHHLLLAVYS
jgi:hypothetical protein